MATTTTADQKLKLKYLEDRWKDSETAQMDEPELLRYRSNLLGSDLRITNFGGGNTVRRSALVTHWTEKSARCFG